MSIPSSKSRSNNFYSSDSKLFSSTVKCGLSVYFAPSFNDIFKHSEIESSFDVSYSCNEAFLTLCSSYSMAKCYFHSRSAHFTCKTIIIIDIPSIISFYSTNITFLKWKRLILNHFPQFIECRYLSITESVPILRIYV